MSDAKPTRSDPTPEKRKGDSNIQPVVITFIVTILVILVAALIFIRIHQSKIVPKANDTPVSQHVLPRTQPPIQPAFRIPA
jgi:cell division protein FtsN